MFVLTADQRSSRTSPNRVPEALTLLRDVTTVCPFERTIGDEFQGILTRADALVTSLITLTRSGGWHIGVGLGTVDTPIAATARTADGPALRAARIAVDEAKKAGSAVFRTEDRTGTQASMQAQAMWRLMATILSARTDRQWHISALADSASGVEIAKAEQVSPQAISRVLRAAHHREISEARAALITLLQPWQEEDV
ncbi:MAG: hypothetical protein Q4Q03_03455 [Bowdeniella nasicola]|nr:hypothetical protein [Bowdeniella nasicola]